MTNHQRQQMYCDAIEKSLTIKMNIHNLINLKIGTRDKTVLTFNRRFMFRKKQRSLSMNT